MGWKLRRKRLIAVGKGKREKQSVSAMLELPEDMIEDILPRLPGEDLLRFRCVSKRCRALIDSLMFKKILSRLPVEDLLRLRCVSRRSRALIDSPMFIKLQLNQSLQTRTNLCVVYWERKLNSVDLDVLESKIGGWGVELSEVVEVDQPMKSMARWTRVECSCNGLFCLRSLDLDEDEDEGKDEGKHETLTLLNPSTKEYRILPPVPHGGALYTFHGIVYDPVGDDYKVFRIVQFYSHSLTSEVMVYSLRSNVWRRGCESFNYYLYLPFPERHTHRYPGVVVNGALHWLASRDEFDVFDIVVALDPVDGQHLEVRVPSVVSRVYYGTLGVLGGCLCVLYAIRHEEEPAEIWVMNDYMVESSWTKLCRVLMMPKIKVALMGMSLARVLGYKMVGSLMWYDLKKRRSWSLVVSFGEDVNVKSLVKLSHYQ